MTHAVWWLEKILSKQMKRRLILNLNMYDYFKKYLYQRSCMHSLQNVYSRNRLCAILVVTASYLNDVQMNQP